MELHGRDVDRDPDMLRPGRRLSARLANDPRADRDDQARVLGHRDEVYGRDQPARWMMPADQRFEGADAILLEVEQRLIVEFELPAFQREAQVALELAALL